MLHTQQRWVTVAVSTRYEWMLKCRCCIHDRCCIVLQGTLDSGEFFRVCYELVSVMSTTDVGKCRGIYKIWGDVEVPVLHTRQIL